MCLCQWIITHFISQIGYPKVYCKFKPKITKPMMGWLFKRRWNADISNNRVIAIDWAKECFSLGLKGFVSIAVNPSSIGDNNTVVPEVNNTKHHAIGKPCTIIHSNLNSKYAIYEAKNTHKNSTLHERLLRQVSRGMAFNFKQLIICLR